MDSLKPVLVANINYDETCVFFKDIPGKERTLLGKFTALKNAAVFLLVLRNINVRITHLPYQ